MIGQVDRSRLQRALRYLKVIDEAHHRSFVCHTISLNSFIQLQISRTEFAAYHVLLKRVADCCVLLHHRTEQDYPEEKILDILEDCLTYKGEKSKCYICDQISMENGYCEICCVMMTTVEDICPICIDETRKEAVWVKTDCGHSYHHECLGKVLDRKCPMCRKVLDGIKII